jgi:IS4 transposase
LISETFCKKKEQITGRTAWLGAGLCDRRKKRGWAQSCATKEKKEAGRRPVRPKKKNSGKANLAEQADQAQA